MTSHLFREVIRILSNTPQYSSYHLRKTGNHWALMERQYASYERPDWVTIMYLEPIEVIALFRSGLVNYWFTDKPEDSEEFAYALVDPQLFRKMTK